jgi:hypothetical protein
MSSLNTAASLRARPSPERIRCIVVESGAAALTSAADGFDETVVITQTGGDPPAVFAQRVMARIAGIERSRRHFDSLTILTGDRNDWASKVARRLIVLGLAAHACAHVGTPELLLKASLKAGPEMRAELLGLTEEVLAQAQGAPLPVRLVFGADLPPEPAPRSGIFPAVRKRHHRQAPPVGDARSVIGACRTWADKKAVVGAARGTPGVRSVHDELRIEP